MNIFQWNVIYNSEVIIQENAFENVSEKFGHQILAN